MALWSRLTSIIAGIGISGAASVVIEPALESKRQDAWIASKAAILDPHDLALLVAQGWIPLEQGEGEALRNGFTADRFDNLVQAALKAAPLATVLDLWRRGQLSEELVDHALAKEQVEPQYWAPIKDLYTTRIPADLLAFAHQRGIVDNPTDPATGQQLIPVSPPTTDVKDVNGNPSPIQQLPVDLDVLAEFRATGWDFTRAAVNARARGLPPAPGELLQLLNRGVISTDEYYVGIGEGDTRNEWRDYLRELARRLLTPHEYAELQLRGFLGPDQRDAGAALSGMTAGDAQLLYDLLGRGLNVHQILIGERRGGSYGGPTDQIPEAFLAALQRGNLRPEFYNLGYAGAETYPSYFVTRSLLEAHIIDADRGTQLFSGLGWPDDLPKPAAEFYYGGGSTTAKRLTAPQQATMYEAGKIDRPTFVAALQALAYPPTVAGQYADYIDAKPAASARTSYISKVKTEYAKGSIDEAAATAAIAATNLPADAQAQLMYWLTLEAQFVASIGAPPVIAPPGGG